MAPLFSRRRKDAAPAPEAAPIEQGAVPRPAPAREPEPTLKPDDDPAPLVEPESDLFEKARAHWSEQIRELSDYSTLTDLTQLEGAIIDITHAHPSGIAQLYAGRATRLSSLVRDPAALAVARETARAMLVRAAEFAERFGAAPVYLALGVGQWGEIDTDGDVRLVNAPLLLRPAHLRELSESDLELTLMPGVEINPELVSALQRAGATDDLAALAAMSVTVDGFSPRATLAQLTQLGAGHLSDFEMSEKLYVGPFVHPVTALQEDLLAVSRHWPEHHIVRALAGDLEVKRHLAVELPERQRTDRAPDAERGVGDLDPEQQAVLDHVVAGYDLILDARPGSDVPAMLSAILADAAASGKSVVYVTGTRRAGRAVVSELEEHGLGSLVLDLQDAAWRTQSPGVLRNSLRPAPDPVDEQAVRALRSDLSATRAKLEEYARALHVPRASWERTAYDALQGLADLTSGPGAPRTTVRFDEETTRALTPEVRAQAVAKLESIARLGGFTLRPEDTPWFGSTITDPDAVTGVLEATQKLGEDLLPRVLADVGRVARETGLERAVSLGDWCEQIEMLQGIRESLDTFIPVIYERSPNDMVIATASSAWRKEKDLPMPASTRRRLTKQAKDMIRPGRTVEDLHAALATIKEQRDVWRRYCPGGGWPHLPQGLGELERTASEARTWLAKPDSVLVDDLLAMPLEELRDRMLTLGSDPSALRYIPEINSLSGELREQGLGALIADLSERKVSETGVANELELAWWASVLESIVRSDANLAKFDGATLNEVSSAFRALDEAQVRTLSGPILRATSRRLARTVLDDKASAQDLWRELAQGHGADLRTLRGRFPELMTTTRPIWVVPALQVGQVLPTSRSVDLMVVDGAQNLPTGALVGALSRATQLVFVGDLSRRSSGVVDELNGTLPSVLLPTDRGQREEHIASFLAGQGYGTLGTVPTRPSPSRIRLHLVDGVGAPAIGSVSVEGVDAEVQRVLELAREHKGESLGIVSLSAICARRIADAMARDPELAALDIPVLEIEEAAGLLRDTVILSVGFAKTPHGRVLHRFGPISTPEGLSLMIDALDAVRHNLEVVSCIAPEELDGDRLSHPGAKLLDALLDFASDSPAGPGSSKAKSAPSAGEADRLLSDLARRLGERGLTVAPQYGFDGGVRIPLAVGHPDCPGELVVAVLTDSPDYIAEPSLRRRDRLWVQRLERHGWDVHMAFSTAVFMDPISEADAIEALVRARIVEAPPAPPEPVVESEPVPAAVPEPDGVSSPEPATAAAEGDEPEAAPDAAEIAQREPGPEPDTSGSLSEDLEVSSQDSPEEFTDSEDAAPEASDSEQQSEPDTSGSLSEDLDGPNRDEASSSESELEKAPEAPVQESLFATVTRDIRDYSDDELDEIADSCFTVGMAEDDLVAAMRVKLGVKRRGKRIDKALGGAAARRLAQ